MTKFLTSRGYTDLGDNIWNKEGPNHVIMISGSGLPLEKCCLVGFYDQGLDDEGIFIEVSVRPKDSEKSIFPILGEVLDMLERKL